MTRINSLINCCALMHYNCLNLHLVFTPEAVIAPQPDFSAFAPFHEAGEAYLMIHGAVFDDIHRLSLYGVIK